MRSIEIVSHCWAGQLEIYAHLLRLQLSSLLGRSQHQCSVTMTVIYNPNDTETVRVVEWARRVMELKEINFNPIPTSKKCLFQRSIGRNFAALATTADVVWFADCDYLFEGECLDVAISQALQYPKTIIYPSTVIANISHAHGDALINKSASRSSPLVDFDAADFQPTSYGKAIGGIQIITGDWCRSLGYLKDTKWTKAMKDTSRGFSDTRCDVRFRKTVGVTKEVEIPGVYRVRHSRCGRREPLDSAPEKES